MLASPVIYQTHHAAVALWTLIPYVRVTSCQRVSQGIVYVLNTIFHSKIILFFVNILNAVLLEIRKCDVTVTNIFRFCWARSLLLGTEGNGILSSFCTYSSGIKYALTTAIETMNPHVKPARRDIRAVFSLEGMSETGNGGGNIELPCSTP